MGSCIAQPSLILPKFLAGNRDLSNWAQRVLILLDDYRNKTTGQCNPRISRLAADLGVCYRTVQRALAELRKWRLITVERCQRTCQYVIAARDQWGVLLCKKISTVVEKSARKFNRDGNVIGQSCPIRSDQFVQSEPAPSITEPTYRTYLSGREAGSPPPSVHHAAAAPPSVAVQIFQGQRFSLRSPFTLKLCETLLKVHPQPGLPVKALVKLDAILQDGSDTAARCAKTIEIRHAQWIEYWNTLEAGKFIPQLWRWLEDRDWMVAPVIRKPAPRAFESAGERSARMWARIEERDAREGRV